MNQVKKKKFFKFDNVGILFVLPAFLYMLVFVEKSENQGK